MFILMGCGLLTLGLFSIAGAIAIAIYDLKNSIDKLR